MGDDERDISALLEAESERAPRPEGLRRSTIRRGLSGRISIVALPVLVVASVAWIAIASPFATDPETDVVAPGPQSQDGLIAFTTQEQGELSPWIAVVPASGGEVTRLHEGRNPAWSPDGTRIVFGCDPGICTMKADGSEVSQLTDPAAPAFDEEPDWGPGGFIAFTRNHMDGSQGRDLLMIRQEGGRPTPLIEEEANFAPSWSPDGQAIAFVRGTGPLLDAPEGGFQLWKTNADGSGLVQLTEDGAGRPDWSPDGSSILFDEASTLWTIPADGGEPRRLSMVSGQGFDVGSFATWAPDSRQVAFTCSSSGTDDNDICLSDVYSEVWTALVATDENEASPAWQPTLSTPAPDVTDDSARGDGDRHCVGNDICLDPGSAPAGSTVTASMPASGTGENGVDEIQTDKVEWWWGLEGDEWIDLFGGNPPEGAFMLASTDEPEDDRLITSFIVPLGQEPGRHPIFAIAYGGDGATGTEIEFELTDGYECPTLLPPGPNAEFDADPVITAYLDSRQPDGSSGYSYHLKRVRVPEDRIIEGKCSEETWRRSYQVEGNFVWKQGERPSASMSHFRFTVGRAEGDWVVWVVAR